MALVYSGGTLQKILVDGSSATNLVTAMKNALVTSGWTASAISGGWNMTSATTSQNLSFRVDITESGGICYFNSKDVDNTISAQTTCGNNATQIYTVAALSYTLICHKFGFFLFIAGSTATLSSGNAANGYYCGVPYLPEPVQPLAVSGATNASPIVITTTTDHDLNNGDYVYITQVAGNTAANGLFQVTYVTDTTFSLNSSTGNGTYTSGGYVGTTGRISRAFFSYANKGGNFFAPDNFGWRYSPQGASIAANAFIVLNELAYSGAASDLALEGAQNAYPWRESRLSITEPYVMGALTTGGSRQLQFQLYNAALVNGTPQSAADALTTFDSKSWHCFGSDADVALFLAYA